MPDIEFLADTNISPSTVKQLRKKGWDIVRISEILDRKSTDIKIINYAKEHNKVIITQDLVAACGQLGGSINRNHTSSDSKGT